jgi:hypothetical protein
MRNRRVFATGAVDADGKAENLDLRWNRHQSVVIGAHPITGAYRWIKHRSPAEIGIAEAPDALIQLLIDAPQPIATPLLTHTAPMPATVPLLEFITKDSRALIESGGTPGQWNDDQLRLALDLQGTEEWIIAQGHRPDMSAAEAFERHISAAQSKAKDFDARKARHRFDGAAAHNPAPGTPPDKLQSRLRFHTRTERPILTERPTPTAQAPAAPEAAPMLGKPTKLEAGELLAMLRTQAGADRIRFNRFSQQVEMDGNVIEGVERYYLSLAEQGYKVSKELAVDCLVQVAHENP